MFVPASKNGKSRHIPLNTEAQAAFSALYARTRGKGPIFASERGGAALQGARRWFEDALAEANIENFTWHDLRHPFASRLVMAGVDLPTVASLMGHLNIQMTMRYAHLAPAHKAAAVEKLSASLERTRQEAAILFSAGQGKATGTTTDTEGKSAQEVAAQNIQ